MEVFLLWIFSTKNLCILLCDDLSKTSYLSLSWLSSGSQHELEKHWIIIWRWFLQLLEVAYYTSLLSGKGAIFFYAIFIILLPQKKLLNPLLYYLYIIKYCGLILPFNCSIALFLVLVLRLLNTICVFLIKKGLCSMSIIDLVRYNFLSSIKAILFPFS